MFLYKDSKLETDIKQLNSNFNKLNMKKQENHYKGK